MKKSLCLCVCFAEFDTWKEEYEKATNSCFIKDCGKKRSNIYYYCNRSGHFKSRSTGIRHLKTQGTSKISGYCTAAIIAQIKSDNCLDVMVCKTHYGHEMSLAHLRIPEKDRLAIAGKLSAGVEFQRILDDVRDSIGDTCERIHLLTRKDLNNIEKAYSFIQNRRHSDDATSVHLWVEEMMAHNLNPVLFYKRQGQTPSKECEQLSANDFAVGIQTPLQADMLKQFSFESVVCVDSTHGTNGYDFNLITLVVVDEHSEGFPVAWCISNREDKTLIQIFFMIPLKQILELSHQNISCPI